MATRTGILSMSMGNSRLDGLLLARAGEPNPLTAASSFLSVRGFGDGDRVTVTGDDGVVGSAPVFFMTNVTAAPAPESISKSKKKKTRITARATPKKKPAGE